MSHFALKSCKHEYSKQFVKKYEQNTDTDDGIIIYWKRFWNL